MKRRKKKTYKDEGLYRPPTNSLKYLRQEKEVSKKPRSTKSRLWVYTYEEDDGNKNK